VNGSVLHVVISLAPGGLERLVVDWTNARNARLPGSTAICCLDRSGELAGMVQADVTCLHARRGRFPFDVSAVLRLRRLVRQGGFKVIHSHNLAALQYSALARAGLRVRHVHTEHGSNPHAAGALSRMRGRWLYGRADAVVAVSEDTRRALESAFGLNPGRVRVIRNGVSINAWTAGLKDRSEQRRELNIPPESCVIGSVGRLAEVKGHDRLVRAFAEMVGRVSGVGADGSEHEKRRTSNTEHRTSNSGIPRSKFDGERSMFNVRVLGPEVSASTTPISPHPDTPTLFLLLVGDGPEREALEALASTLGIAERVTFAGFRADARELLSTMDLFVLPSRSEGLSVSLLEAMAGGVPVAVTDVGANLEVIENGAAGTVLPADEAAWPEIMEQAAREVDVGRVRRAAERVGSVYSLDRTVEAYENLYTFRS